MPIINVFHIFVVKQLYAWCRVERCTHHQHLSEKAHDQLAFGTAVGDRLT